MDSNKVENKNDSIYYYTSNFVLIEWLKNKKIWATRSITSNDSVDTIYAMKYFKEFEEKYEEEYQHVFKEVEQTLKSSKNVSLRVFKDIIKDFTKNHFDSFIDMMINLKDLRKPCETGDIQVYDLILSKLQNEEIKKYLNIDFDLSPNVKSIITRFPYPYVISFSHKKDNRFLWDSYTNNTGVCLEFSWNGIGKYLTNTYKNSFLGQNVCYDPEMQREEIEWLLEKLIPSNNSFEIEQLIGRTPLLKHEYWESEDEFRAIFSVKYFNDKYFDVKENYNLKYNNGYKTQDYIEVDIPLKYLKSITIGPLNPKNEVNEFKKFIKDELDNKLDSEEVNEVLNYLKDKILLSKGIGVLKK